MKKKNNLIKNIFYIFFAFCLFSVGTATLNLKHETNYAMAEDTSSETINNQNLPSYFSKEEFLVEGNNKTLNENGLISSDTFLYFTEGTSHSELSLSLEMNGHDVNSSNTNDLYNFVYYPDKDNSTLFNYYSINSINFYINGQYQDINMGDFIIPSGLSFANDRSSTQLEGFEMIFNNTGSGKNEINVLSYDGQVVEGVYNVSLTLTLYTCTDGGKNGEETQFSDENVTINYSFYVVDRENYLANNRPNVSRNYFDKEVSVSQMTNPNYAYYLYSNYSSEGEKNKLPYIDYDYTRFELEITKEILNTATTINLVYDKDIKSVIADAKDVINYTVNNSNHTCRVFFTNVGDYTVTFKAIQLVDYSIDETQVEERKYTLDGLSNITKKFMVYVYGYQANYTDLDGETDENNIRPVGELKTNDFNNGSFKDSADITSAFINSDANYSQENSNTTFLIGNVLNYINTNDIAPVKTNQTPIKLSANATLSQGVNSYVFSTTKISDAFSSTAYRLNGQTLYRANFNGRTESTAGKYIYILAYTYKNYYESETTLANTKVFFQVFYFEITKDLPSIELKTQNDNKSVYTDTFVNQNVKIIDSTKDDPYNKDVTIQIYAWDYNTKTYLSEFGGANGISFENLSATDESSYKVLENNAYYTIRMYYSNELTDSNVSINSNKGFFREQSFTIDKNPISNITARNVVEITNSTDYRIVSSLNDFTTNQNMILSWDEKNSGAKTYAYYRYFPIVDAQYYSNREAILSTTIERMLNYSRDASYLPVNNILDLSTANSNWLQYHGNTVNSSIDTNIATEYVLSDSGLYLVDVYDEAGNHSVDVFMIDTTTPLFAVFDGDSYKLTSSSIYVTSNSTLFWANYKSIYINNFNTVSYNSTYTPETIQESDLLSFDFYKTYNNKVSTDIFKAMYNKLKAKNYLDYLNSTVSISGEIDGTAINNYSSYYLNIPINELSYYTDRAHTSYTPQHGVYKQEIPVEYEMTYRVLIRDLSNTKFDANYDATATIQYTNYCSARQTILISFDSSKFFVQYTNSQNQQEILSSNNTVEENYDETDSSKKTKTTYLNPTSLQKPFTLSFLPTDDKLNIQVDKVTIKYYPYVEASFKDETTGVIYYYYELSDKTTEITVYDFLENGSSTDLIEEEIRLNSDNVTTAGKYEISRTYYDGTGYTYNENDYFKRTYVLYVDRNEVISNAEPINDENGSHLESLVGGDVFVAMYDNKKNSSLVVTFPNSDEGNTNGSSLYNNGNARTVLTTNMLPVYVYIPQYKYTKRVQKVEKTDGYDFKVENNNEMNFFSEDNLIVEYALYAELYKDGTNSSNLLAVTSNNISNPTLNTVIADENGFLKFYLKNGESLNYLKDAGTYYVKLYQGRFGTEIGENDYEQSITFSFTVKESNPDFKVQLTTGSDLNSDIAADNNTRYYTNQSVVNLLWDAGSTYMAEIDIEKIKFETSKGQVFSSSDDVFAQRPVMTNDTYIAQLNLEKLNIYENNAWVKITMQYKNHDDEFYDKISKYIYVDLSAPSTNIQNLVNKTTAGGLIAPLTNNALRTYYTAKMEQTNNLDNTCYNLSNSTGTFAYYSYSVASDYLQTLKNTISSEGFQTFVREFVDSEGVNTKYTSSAQQETSPADFLVSNFTEINSSNFKGFEPNKYYEIVETDRAGNMSIYTIYVTTYSESETNQNNNIISYIDAEGNKKAYTIADYQQTKSYNNAIHNIYAKTGFQLEDINYFGDEWIQFKLQTLNANGFATTRYLMLTPWDKNYAYAFVGNNFTKIEISDLIDGLTSTRYKNSLTFYNRENGNSEAFYVNVRNTTLPATLTNSQEREYIRFTQPTDQAIQNTTNSSTFLTGLTIKANNEIIYSQQNQLGYASLWQSNSNVIVTADRTQNTITFEINPELGFVANTRIVYEYTDNYGLTYKEIHLYKETIITREISSDQDLYAYYENTNGRLVYITKNGFKYSYNPSKYSVTPFDFISGEKSISCEKANFEITQDSNGISTITLTAKNTTEQYNNNFVLEVRDFNDNNLIKTIYFTLYNELPQANYTTENNKAGQFKLLDASRNNITKNIVEAISDDETGYFSEVTLLYSNKETFIPVKYSISTDKSNWEEVSSGTILKSNSSEMQKYYLKVWYDETYINNEFGTAEYIFENVPVSQIFEFNLSSQTSTFWIEKTINGSTTVVDKSNTIYTTASGTRYSNHYIVNLSYTDKDSVQIKTNKEQEITATLIDTFTDSSSVKSEHWLISNTGNPSLGNIPAFNTNIIITYIPSSDNFVDEFYTYNTSGIIDTTENLVNQTSKSVVISEDYSSINRIELQWSKYYGIVQNEINIRLVKDGVELSPIVYTRRNNGKEYNYLYLTHSGKYTISLIDNAGNVQKFNRGNAGQTEAFNFIFLKDVPFTMTYTNPLTEQQETSAPIKQAVYNGQVTINLDKTTRSDFYTLDGYPVLSVKKNGVALSEDEIKNLTEDSTTATKYNFTEAGYYEIFFTATSNLPDVGKIRRETYQFTILNANEYRYSYVFNKYANYYIEKVERDGKDITDTLLKTLDVSTITVDRKLYMTELPLSYLDEKTGAGTYLITINSNDTSYRQSSMPTSWTYKVIIQVGTAPIRISVAEGAGTTEKVDVVFNQENIYQEMGECVVRIIKYTDDTATTARIIYSTEINAESTGEGSATIDRDEKGSFYVQIVSPSGNLLFSYKVVKNEPMNPATIIAIVISVVVALVVVFLIFKLRKRISVK